MCDMTHSDVHNDTRICARWQTDTRICTYICDVNHLLMFRSSLLVIHSLMFRSSLLCMLRCHPFIYVTHSYMSLIHICHWFIHVTHSQITCVLWLITCGTVRFGVLQRVAACCSVLQRVAACCCVLQCVAACCSVCCSMLQRVALWCALYGRCASVCCSVVQCVAVCCSVVQCVAVCCSVVQCVAVCCNALHRPGTVCCSVLQCVAVGITIICHKPGAFVVAPSWIATPCNTLQHTATHCNTLKLTTTHNNTLQYTDQARLWCGGTILMLSILAASPAQDGTGITHLLSWHVLGLGFRV